MKVACAVILGLGLIAAPAFAEPDVAAGEALYQQRCGMCHDTGLGGSPLMDALTKLDPQKIVDTLTTPGTMMAGVVAGISEENKRDVAVFLTRKGMPAKDSLPEVKPAP
jgi:mono/diheme cytochrome c family protein